MNHIGDEVCRVMGSQDQLAFCSNVRKSKRWKNVLPFMAAIASMVTAQDFTL